MIPFVKMHGAGNDFVVLDNRDSRFSLQDLISLAPRLCDRRLGIGADGLLVIEPSSLAEYRMVYRNADGSDAGMCGNGGRCIAAFAISLGFPASHHFECHGHVYAAETVNQDIRLDFPTRPTVSQNEDGFRIDAGTDHLVVPVPEHRFSDRDFLIETGRRLRHKHNANVNFVPEQPQTSVLRLRTYERGVEDLTLACGTGALAAATWRHHAFETAADGEFSIDVRSEGGVLNARFRITDGKTHTYQLTGPTARVFEGRIPL